MKNYLAILALSGVLVSGYKQPRPISEMLAQINSSAKPNETQTKFSVDGEPLHGIVGWDDLNMKPTQEEENGARSDAAATDEFEGTVFKKYADSNGILDRSAALGAVQEIVAKWDHLSPAQTNYYLRKRFDRAYDDFSLSGKTDKPVSVDEMYGLVNQVYFG